MVVVMMKGQIFLITAIFIVVILVLLRVQAIGLPDTQKTSLYNDFSSIKTEYTRVVDTSLINSQNLSQNLQSFTDFSKQYYDQKGLNYTATYNVSIIGSNTTVQFHIYLGDDKSYLSDSFTVSRIKY